MEVWTWKGLKRFLVLFFIDVATRQVEIAGISCGPWWDIALYIAVGFVWPSFVDEGEVTVNKKVPDLSQFAALLCFFLFVDNVLGRLERAREPARGGSDLANGSSYRSSPVLASSPNFCTGPRPSVQVLVLAEELESMRFRFFGQHAISDPG